MSPEQPGSRPSSKTLDELSDKLDSLSNRAIVEAVLESAQSSPPAPQDSRQVTGSEVPPRYKAYVASALTGLSESRRNEVFSVQEQIRRCCAPFGIVAHLPKDISDPVKNPDIPPSEVFRLDQGKVLGADLVILLTHEPSFGAGQELEFARQALIPIILIIPGGKQVSRMVLGIPSTILRVTYSTPEELATNLGEALIFLRPILQTRALLSDDRNLAVLGPNVRRLREESQLSRAELANAVGITEDEVLHIEESPDHLSNPSIKVLRRMAAVLKSDLVRLVAPDYDELIIDDVSRALEAVIAPEGRHAGSGYSGDRKKIARRVARKLLEFAD